MVCYECRGIQFIDSEYSVGVWGQRERLMSQAHYILHLHNVADQSMEVGVALLQRGFILTILGVSQMDLM